MNTPVMNTARRAPGEPRLAEGAPPPERMACPRKNETKLRSTQKTTVATAVDADLGRQQQGPSGSGGQRGADGAARVLAGDEQRPEHAAGQAGDDEAGQRLLGRVEADVVAGAVVQVGVGHQPRHQQAGDDGEAEVMAVERRVRILRASDRTTCLRR